MKQTLQRDDPTIRHCPDCRQLLPKPNFDDLFHHWRMNCICGVVLMWYIPQKAWIRTHRAGPLFSLVQVDKPKTE